MAAGDLCHVGLHRDLAHAGKYADAAGIYPADPKGECKSHKLYGRQFPDDNVSGVCVPITTLMNEEMQPLLRLGIVELTNPQQLEAMERHESLRLQPAEGYKVEIDSFNDDIFKLVDDSILEKTGSGYVVYIGYRKEASSTAMQISGSCASTTPLTR